MAKPDHQQISFQLKRIYACRHLLKTKLNALIAIALSVERGTGVLTERYFKVRYSPCVLYCSILILATLK